MVDFNNSNLNFLFQFKMLNKCLKKCILKKFGLKNFLNNIMWNQWNKSYYISILIVFLNMKPFLITYQYDKQIKKYSHKKQDNNKLQTIRFIPRDKKYNPEIVSKLYKNK